MRSRTHGVIVLVVPGADDRALVRPDDAVGDGHGRGDAFQPNRVGGGAVLDPGAADRRRAFHGHRDLGAHLAEPRRGRLAPVTAGGRGRHDQRQIARRADHLRNGNGNTVTNGAGIPPLPPRHIRTFFV